MHFHRLLGAALAALAILGFQHAEAANSPLTQKRGTITTQNLVAAGACTTGGCVESEITTAGSVTVQVTGTYTASGGLSAQATTDGATWVTLCSTTCTTTFTRATTGATSATIASGVQDVFQVPATGYKRMRITALGAVTGTATITIQPTELVPSGFASISGGAGDASAANQATGNASLASIDTKTPALGQALAAASVPVILPAATITTLTPPAAITGFATASAQTTGNNSLAAIDAGIPAALGTAVMTASMPVTIATNDTLMSTINTSLGTLNTSVNTASNYEATKDAAVPSRLVAMGARIGANADAVAQGATTVAINVSTATTTQLVALSGTTKIYITGLAVIAGGTGNITFVYGTGSSCGTGTTSISGALPLVANSGLTLGSGLGAVMMVPAGQALCITTSAAVQMSGFVTYAQF